MSRFGVATQRAFLTNVVVILVGRANGLTMMQLLHHALGPRATAMSVDDSNTTSPVYFFDLALDDIRVKDLPMRAAVFGLKGMANAHLPTLLATGHAFVIVSDGADDPAIAARTIAARVPELRREEVYALRITNTDEARDALLAVLEDVAAKAAASS